MPINVYYQNNSDQVCVLRPAPLISISEEIKKSEGGEKFGTRYNITLTGTLLDDGGFPLAYDPRNNTIIAYRDSTYNSSRSLAGPYDSWDVAVQHANQSHYMKEVPRQAVTFEQKLDAMFWKQKMYARTLCQRRSENGDTGCSWGRGQRCLLPTSC